MGTYVVLFANDTSAIGEAYRLDNKKTDLIPPGNFINAVCVFDITGFAY